MSYKKYDYPYNVIVKANGGENNNVYFSENEMRKMKLNKNLEATFECILLTEKNINARGREIVRMYFKDNRTYDEIAVALDISRSRVGQIVNKSIRTLSKGENRQKLVMGFEEYYKHLADEAHRRGFEQGNFAGYTKACSEDKEQRKVNRGALTIDELFNQGMSVRLYNSLKRGGIGTIADIINDVDKVIMLRNFGKSCIIELVRLLEENGIDTADFKDYLYTGAYKELAAQRVAAKK